MSTSFKWIGAAALFAVVATANSGGYRYGASDQAFYQPAIAIQRDPSLFPRDREVLLPQTRFMLGDKVLGLTSRATGVDLPPLFVAAYVATLVVLFAGGVALARSLGADWWTVATLLALMTLRHRIAKTGANTLEGYMHLRMLAFGFGLFSMASILRNRFGRAAAWTALAAVVHTTTAFWFGATTAIAFAWREFGSASAGSRRHTWQIAAAALILAGLVAVAGPLRSHLTIIDPAWLAVIAEKDYLFPGEWPAYAWALNLAYPVILVLIHRRRNRFEVTAPGETALVAGLLGLVAIFLVTVPLTELRLALAVQMQINRVFWLLDAVVGAYLAWWLTTDLPHTRPASVRTLIVGAVIAVALARGYYVLNVEANRPLVEVDLPKNAWTDAMRWLRAQPPGWNVLADPQHAWKYGVSVRVAAERDTPLEQSKDTALAMYDRDLALRVADRGRALVNFDTLADADLRALDRTYALDAFVDRADRRFSFPILYRNDQFVIYDLR